jgi:hypothetical protein
MTAELESLRSAADRVRPPSFDALEAVARRRTRQAAVAATVTGALAVAVTVVGIAVATSGEDRSAPEPVVPPTPSPTVTLPPTPTPTPTHRSDSSMTPAEVVAADDAVLLTAGFSLDDPAFRVSVWQAVCHWCPRGEVTPVYRALAITSDAYATTSYLRPPFELGSEYVESVGPGLLAIVGSGQEWLVREDGTVTELGRDYEEVEAADPRLWVVCEGDPPGVDPAPQDGAPSSFDPQPTWCAVDPEANAIHVWLGPWIRTLDDSESVVSPGAGEPPWGVRFPSYGPGRPAPASDRVETWWEAGGSRQREDLGPLGPGDATGPVLNGAPGVMSCWIWHEDSPTISVITSTDHGESWQDMSLGVPFRPDSSRGLSLSWTPAAGLLARLSGPRYGFKLYRADAADGAPFEPVLDARSSTLYRAGAPWVVRGDRIATYTFWSDDDGRTWSETTPWRP